jgi:hypothetical protein
LLAGPMRCQRSGAASASDVRSGHGGQMMPGIARPQRA